MTPSAAENGVGSAFWDRRRPPRTEGDERPETEGRVDLMERDAEAGAAPRR